MLLDRHRAKMVTAEQLVAAVGTHPRARTVVLCHGVFDIVHPGHLRHLSYAKSVADVLVVSVTSDRHVTKGPYRPHVPQDLRAGNLAMLDIVDYVVVCDEARPTAMLSQIRPDYYAKGFEYSSARGRTIEEAAVVEAYGGQVLFTAGDVVYSSSALIDSAPPDLRYDRLALVMSAGGVTFDDLLLALNAMAEQRVHVVGDVIVDALLHCAVVGGTTKTPTISVRRERCDQFVGGAGIVAKHMRAVGAQVSLGTVVGNDAGGQFVVDDLEAAGVVLHHVVDNARPTTRKEAVVAGGYRLLKIDTVDNRTISDRARDQLCEGVAACAKMSALVYSDFRHGIFNGRTIPAFRAVLDARRDLLTVADSQVASRWGNITDFTDFDLITPNEREARFALADQDSGVRPLASRLYDEARCRTLIMKLGERGMITCLGADHESPGSFLVLDSFADRVVDPVGAGDAVLAYAALALRAGRDPVVASILGSMAAGCACESDGNIPVHPEYVAAKIERARSELRS